MKDLMVIMMRAGTPVKMSSGYIVILSTESFMSVSNRNYKINTKILTLII